MNAKIKIQNFFRVIRFRSSMFNALRYYWIISRGYRLRPWKSPYIQWRFETFFGPAAADLDARKFFSLLWRERARFERFFEWVTARRRAQHKKPHRFL